METKLEMILAGQTGGGKGRPSPPKPKKYVMDPTYCKADSEHIWYKGGYCWSYD